MSKEALKERIELTFKNNESYTELYATSDNNVFTDLDLAKQNAIRLRDTNIETYKRPKTKNQLTDEQAKAEAQAKADEQDKAEAQAKADEQANATEKAKGIEVKEEQTVKKSGATKKK